ncbi:hypothetical protein AWZ03_004213 [Drosophila navojoa]|uniref:Mitochondrial cardiolipin hydrolase n=1 Tax=Drosophila navojoa TaxID=7232 RepID=A0A484BNA7_DRONA|nr:hypothetical protein AWZ03_004213 [Drosophila navojoa]
MEVIDIEEPTPAVNTAKPKTPGTAILLKVKRENVRIVVKGNKAYICMRCEPQQQPDFFGTNDLLADTLEIAEGHSDTSGYRLADDIRAGLEGQAVGGRRDPGTPLPPNVMLHQKLCIIDGEQCVLALDKQQRRWHHRLWYRTGYVLTGSLNWTKVGTGRNFENVVIASNRVNNALCENLFNDMWKHFPVLDLEAFDSIIAIPFEYGNNAPALQATG